MLGLGRAQIPAKCPTRENGLAHLSAVRPNPCLRTQQACERAASSERSATRSRQRNLREELCLRNSNFRVGRVKDLFRLANVRAPFQESRRKSCRHLRWQRLFYKRSPPRHGLRIISEQNTDGVFFLSDLSFQIRNLRVCSVECLLRLQDIQLGGYAMFDAQFRKLGRILLR